MNRVLLEQLNIEGLRELVRQHNLDTKGARMVLFDRLTDHFERNGWPESISITGPTITDDRTLEEEGAQNSGCTGSQPAGQDPTTGHMVSTNIQEIVQAVLQALQAANRRLFNENRRDKLRTFRHTKRKFANKCTPKLESNKIHGKINTDLRRFGGRRCKNLVRKNRQYRTITSNWRRSTSDGGGKPIKWTSSELVQSSRSEYSGHLGRLQAANTGVFPAYGDGNYNSGKSKQP